MEYNNTITKERRRARERSSSINEFEKLANCTNPGKINTIDNENGEITAQRGSSISSTKMTV